MDKDDENIRTLQLGFLDQIAPRGTRRFVLCFRTPQQSSLLEITRVLRIGLHSLTCQLPYLSGNVTCISDRNHVCVKYAKDIDLRCSVQDRKNDMPSYEELRKWKFPPSSISVDALYPQSENSHVLALQANLLEGGIILGIVFHRSVADIAGLYHIFEILARGLNSVNPSTVSMFQVSPSFQLPEAPLGNRLRLFDNTGHTRSQKKQMLDWYDENAVGIHGKIITPDEIGLQRHKEVHAAVSYTFRQFFFSVSKIEKLVESFGAGSQAEPVSLSVSDVLIALLWRSITKAREPRLDTPASSQLGVTIDCRGRLARFLPTPYLGNAMGFGVSRMSIYHVAHNELFNLARAVKKVNQTVGENEIISLVLFVENFDGNIERIQPTLNFAHRRDVVVDSWSHYPFYDLHFGYEFGQVDCFRVPPVMADGLVKILPLRKDALEGDIQVIVQLDEKSMEDLLKDDIFMGCVEDVLQ